MTDRLGTTKLRPRTVALFWLSFLLAVVLASYLSAAAEPVNTNPTVQRIEALGGTVRLYAREADSLEVDFRFADPPIGDDALKLVADLEAVVALQLRGAAISDAGLAEIAKAPRLKRLGLEQTKITDAGLSHLLAIGSLTHLNLRGTPVSDRGVATLAQLPRLRYLNVGETAVSEAQILQLQQAIEGLEVIPDRAADRRRATIALEYARATLAAMEKAYALAEKEFAGTDVNGLKKAFDTLNKQAMTDQAAADQWRKKIDASKESKTADQLAAEQALEQAETSKQQAEQAKQRYDAAKKKQEAVELAELQRDGARQREAAAERRLQSLN